MGELSDRLVAELVDAVRVQLRKEQSERQRDVYLIGDIDITILSVFNTSQNLIKISR